MKTILLLLISSLFLSNVPDDNDKISSEKIMIYNIENRQKIKTSNNHVSRTPIIILKRD